MTPAGSSAPSYRALFQVPTLGRVLLSMQLARVAQAMFSVAIVLFALAEYESAAVAGIVAFAALFPGIVLSPVAGALLDRHGRVRLIAFDYLVAATTMLLIGSLAVAESLPVALLVLIAAVSSVTGPLSQTGLRSLFPLMTPRHLWERVNAMDSAGYVIAGVLGPPVAAGLVAIIGPRLTMLALAVPYLFATVALVGVREPPSTPASSGRLLRDAWDGVRYVWSNRSLRGLGFSIATLNISGGMQAIVVPLIVLQGLGGSEAMVGIVFAMSGLAGIVAVTLSGRLDSRGREWRLLVVPMAFMAPATAVMLVATGTTDPTVGYLALAISLVTLGLLAGPMDIALFTTRQRRTDPSHLGRAFAISMAFNGMGIPVGSALAGVLATESLDGAIWLGIGACAVATLFAAVLVPRHGDADDRTR